MHSALVAQAGTVLKCVGNTDSDVRSHTFGKEFEGFVFGERKLMTWEKPSAGCMGGCAYFCNTCAKVTCEFCYTHAMGKTKKRGRGGN